MSSPIERVSSNDTLRAPRRAGGSSTSLSSLPSRLAQPTSAEVQLDVSQASSSSTTRQPSATSRPKSVLPTIAPASPSAAVNPKARPRTSIIESSSLWKSSAAKRAEKQWALQTERSLYSDAKFKKYLSLIDRTLASFDSVSEWADFISFLARLHKAIQAYPTYNVIPRKLIVAKRLAQCLNPALPSGVHQRALDVYHHILSVIGPHGLRRDLQVWTSGLLPFFQYASTSVKPSLLGIYEAFYLPLQDDLRPLTKALQMALLPGLEEETSEYYERTLRLLDSISDAVTQPLFLQNLWLTLITTPSVRLAALNFLTRRMPPVENEQDPTLLVGKDLGLMVRGLAHALDDDSLLVRRNTLEILVTHVKMDKPLFRQFVKRPDQILLVRSALHVVLRKDLSLNRRLYTWLLGADETPATQIAFLAKNGLDLVRSALKERFDKDVLDAGERQKPYRIFISLLDKWEIGQSLTRVLALDAFHAISLQVARGQEEDLMTTAKMLFEVVDPFLLYGQFFQAITQQFQPSQAEKANPHSPLSLLCFILKAFHIHDEETKQIHVPLLFAAVCQLLHHKLHTDKNNGDDTASLRVLDALELLKLLVTIMPSRVFVRIASSTTAATITDFLDRASKFYASSETDSQQAARHFLSFQDRSSATALVQLLAQVCLKSGQLSHAEGTETFVRALDVFADVMRVVDGSEATEEIALVTSSTSQTHKLDWDASTWTSALLPHLDRLTTFAEAERIVEVLISCCICRALATPIQLDPPQVLNRIVASLLRYLAPEMSPYHVRAVELLWATHKVTSKARLETAMTQQLRTGSPSARSAALVAFGTFWRLSEDVSTDELRTPLLLVLDKLQSLDAEERQQAEMWLRGNLRSYIKVVDPLLHMLVLNRPQVQEVGVDVDGLQIKVKEVDEPLNDKLVLYALRTLSALARFGGSGFAKVLATTPVSASISTATKHLVRSEAVAGSSSYLEVILDECSLWIGAYPSPDLKGSYEGASTALRAAAVDVALCLIQRSALPPKRVDQMETLLIETLLVAVHQGSISGQSKMLHTLHTLLAAKTSVSQPDLLHRRMSSTSQATTMHQRGESTGRADIDTPPVASPVLPPKPTPSKVAGQKQPHRLLLPLLQRGLSTPSNRPVIQHWSDFVLMTAPLYRSSVHNLLLPLNHTVCELLSRAMTELGSSYSAGASRLTFGAEQVVPSQDTQCSFLESDLLLLINLAERSLMLATNSHGETSHPPRNAVLEPNEKGEAPGLLNYVSGVFTSDIPPDANQNSSSGGNLLLTIRTLHRVWTQCNLDLPPTDAKSLSLDAMRGKIQLRCRRTFERIYRAHPADTVESLLQCWAGSAKSSRSREAVMEILGVVTPSKQILVTFLCDVLGARISRSDSNTKKTTAAGVGDATLFLFFDSVLSTMEPSEATQVWPVVIVFVKDFVANGMGRKVHVYPMLRIFTALAEKICLTAAMEDKRTRRELQDNYAKLVDSCILIAGRSFDQSTWMRRSGRDNGEELDKEAAEFASALLSQEPDSEGATGGLIDAINHFLASRAFGTLRKIQMDSDRIAGLIANAVYYIIAPAGRTRSQTLDIDSSVLAVVSELVRLPASVKAWRSTVADIFGDARFFSMPLSKALRFKPIILALMTQDKQQLIDLLSRISTTAAAANIFANRELEILSRALNLRRLSFTLYSGERDAFLTQLPLIQEKLVDLLRSQVAEILHAEVYLCLRVVLVRFDTRHLTSFWPVLMTELMRLFDGIASEVDRVGSADGRALLLSTLKLLDLLVLVQPEEFQLNEWLFITDTIDAVYPSDDFQSETLLDGLSTALQRDSSKHSHTPSAVTGGEKGRKRKLQLGQLRSISSVGELVPFLNAISQNAFEATYEDREVDEEDVERCLLRDMFDSDASPSGDGGAGGDSKEAAATAGGG